MKFLRGIFLTLVGFGLGAGISFLPVVASANEVVNPIEIGMEVEGEGSAETPVIDSSSVEESLSEGEDPTAGLVPESEGSKWFDEYIMPFLIGIIAPLGGTIAGGSIIFKGIVGLKDILKLAIGGLSKAKEQTDSAETSLIEAKEKMALWQAEQEKQFIKWKESQSREVQEFLTEHEETFKAWQATQAELLKNWEENFEKSLTVMFERLEKVIADKVSDTNNTVHKLLDVEKIAYGDNPVLVSNGTAKKIAEVVDK